MSDEITVNTSVPTDVSPDEASNAPTVSETERLTALLSEAPAVPAPCEDGELAAVDFSRLDVLIGTVRSDGQFDYCVESHTYYVPARTVTPEDLPVAVIALYEEGLNRKAGIKRYGEVTETHVVKRKDIPVLMSRNNPDETYYLFTVKSWRYLETPIAIQDTARGKPLFTNTFLLNHCRRSYQLAAIRSPEEYRLCQLLCGLCGDAAEGKPLFRRVGEYHLIAVAEGQLRLLDAGGHCLFACPVGMTETAPAEVLRGVARGLGLRP